MHKGFVLPLIILGILFAAAYMVLATKFVTVPTTVTATTNASIPKYNKAKNWEIENKKTICILNFNNCENPPSVIKFTARDDWPTIYRTYQKDMPQYGWSSKSQIVTSVPSSIVFVKSNCQISLEGKKSNFLDKSEGFHTYVLTTICS